MAQLMSTGWAEGDDASGRRPRPCSMGPITSATSNGKPNSLASKVAHTMNRIEGMKRRDARLRRNDDGEHFDARFKVVLLGDSGVGKTSLIRSAMGEDFNPSMISTIGIDFVNRTYQVENYNLQLQIWDTAGQERYRSLATSSFRDAKAFIIVYDITYLASFTRIREAWLPLTDSNSNEPVPVFFVGNKSDLVRIRQVPVADVEKLAHQQYAHGVFETSARTGNNVNALFQAVAESMLSTWGVPKLCDNLPPVPPIASMDEKRIQLHEVPADDHGRKKRRKKGLNKLRCCQ
uniref:Ras-related protein Rab-13 n=1 Tax=Schistocephalus solidus TaxID=70667 RepID=A0A0X3QAJ3_SCHSO